MRGGFSYRDFYEKRIKRIIPNLLLVLTFVSVLGYCFLLPNEYIELGKHIDSSSYFTQNFRLLGDVGYFTEEALRKPLLHLWSLAIEEQFYIVFPIICVIFWRLRSKRLIGCFVFLITAGSLAACFLCQDRNFNFYFPLTRFWEIGAGIVLSYIESFDIFQTRRLALGLRNILSCVGLVCVLVPMLMYTQSLSHPGIITVAPVLGAVFMIAANPDAVINRSLLSWRPITFVGLISYSLYLWHWPILSFLYICIPYNPSVMALPALGLSFIIAAVVYYYIENPIRRSQCIGRFSTVGILVTALIVVIVGGHVLKKSDGFPNRAPISVMMQAGLDDGGWTGFHKLGKIPVKDWYIRTQNKNAFPSIVFVGDSHVEQYYRKVASLEATTGIASGILSSSGCFMFNPSLTEYRADSCKKASDALFGLIADKRVKTLVVAHIWGRYLNAIDVEFNKSVIRFKEAIAQRPDLKVYVVLDNPWSTSKDSLLENFDPKFHYNRLSHQYENSVLGYPKDESWSKGNLAISSLLQGVSTLIPVAPVVCPNQKCDIVKWYRDANHLKPNQLEKEAVWLDQVYSDSANK